MSRLDSLIFRGATEAKDSFFGVFVAGKVVALMRTGRILSMSRILS